MKKVFILGCLLFAATAIVSPKVSADVNNFVIRSFHANYALDTKAVGGSLDTTEKIDVTYASFNHGILRAIPKTYRGYDTKLKVLSVERDGQKEPYKVESQGDNKVLRIGDAQRTITGPHSYTIRYSQERVVNFVDGKQSFYWDVNGTDWSQPFESVSASVVAASTKFVPASGTCVTGGLGSQSRNCVVTQDVSKLNAATTQALRPNENMSLEVFFDGTPFVEPTWKNKVADNYLNIVGLGFGLLISLVPMVYWWRRGRDYRGSGVIIPEYQPPKGLGPAEVGMLADYNIDGRDVSATIIDLAVRGYIKIYDDTKKLLVFKQRQFSLELTKADIDKLKSYEAELIRGLFGDVVVGKKISLNKVNRTSMQKAMRTIQKDVKSELTKEYGLIDVSASSLQATFVALGILAWSGLIFIHPNVGYVLGMIIVGLSFFVFGILMKRRTHAGVEMYEKVLGLKLYMNTTQKDRLKMLQSTDRPYAEPTKTVELFEKLLPFAVALGVEKSWSKQFQSILTEPPSWYSGSTIVGFNASQLASGIGSATQTFSSSVESRSSSSGGSGGGGGGGGGGGW